MSCKYTYQIYTHTHTQTHARTQTQTHARALDSLKFCTIATTEEMLLTSVSIGLSSLLRTECPEMPQDADQRSADVRVTSRQPLSRLIHTNYSMQSSKLCSKALHLFHLRKQLFLYIIDLIINLIKGAEGSTSLNLRGTLFVDSYILITV